ncbi:hypothetical protein GCM10010387_48410 [Streptomyces inusitatus]|uniref:Uncharacterized protein n=1 Tax=Streptomyces inusitatus TaxID=68221 RepID=A0A918QGJ7_9ACTN|nr:hypothetical protein [Streptomyces inusitatus]GGZ48423.1 hypothetical protein GCM10010387_48410 [Streptomyces inusitatus]
MNPTDTDKTTDDTTAPSLRKDGEEAPAETAEALAPESPEASDASEVAEADADAEELDESPRESSGLLAATAGVVAAGLGVIGLSGSWVGTIAAERQSLLGRFETSQSATPAEQIAALYGDAWHTTALVNGVFATLAVIVGIAVLALPRTPVWIRAVAAGGAVLGLLGLLAAIGMYVDVLPMPDGGGAGAGGGS